MSQPFRHGAELYEAACWEGLRIELLPERIEVLAPMPLRMLSNAVNGGGFASANRIVNWKVPLHYAGSDPGSDTVKQLAAWNLDSEATIALLTAAKLTHVSLQEESGNQFSLVCCATAGTSNAASAGSPRETFPSYMPGTINIIVLVDGRMTDAAMVNAIITITEAKSAALRDLGIRDACTGLVATSTTTDAVVLGVNSRSSRYTSVHRYAGAATEIGNAIGRLVYESVYEAARTQREA